MGEIWLAEDPSLHRQVAIKTLPFYLQNHPSFLQRFEQEAQAAAALQHPHILAVHDYGKQSLSYKRVIAYFVMPYITGGSLAQRIYTYTTQHQLMPPQEALTYLKQAATAIDYAHTQGFIHCDIKPNNMLLRDDGWLLLADFGIARMFIPEEPTNQKQTDPGTPLYIAPEQAQAQTVPASDIYSLAVIAYQLFTGYLPFYGDTNYAIAMSHMTQPPPAPASLNPDLPAEIANALLTGLEKQPDLRPTSAQTFIQQLRNAVTGTNYSSPPTRQQLLRPEHAPITPVPENIAEPQTEGSNDKQLRSRLARNIHNRRYFLLGAGATVLTASGTTAWLWSYYKQPATALRPAIPAITDSYVLLQEHNTPPATLVWSPVNNILTSTPSGNETIIRTWDMQTIIANKDQLPRARLFDPPSNGVNMLLAWSPDGEMLAIANAALTAKGQSNLRTSVLVYTKSLEKLADDYPEPLILQGATDIKGLTWTSEGDILVQNVLPYSSSMVEDHGTLAIWHPIHTQKTASFLKTPDPYQVAYKASTAPSALSIVPGTNPPLLSLITARHGPKFYQLQYGQQEYQLQEVPLELQQYEHADKFLNLAWSPDGQQLATINVYNTKTYTLDLWQMPEGKHIHTLLLPDESHHRFSTLVWHPDTRYALLAVGDQNGNIYIWDTQHTFQVIQTKTPPTGIKGQITALAWSTDGSWLAAAYDDLYGSILVWKM